MQKCLVYNTKVALQGDFFLFLKRFLNRCHLMFCGACAVSDRKDTKLLKAIHNYLCIAKGWRTVSNYKQVILPMPIATICPTVPP